VCGLQEERMRITRDVLSTIAGCMVYSNKKDTPRAAAARALFCGSGKELCWSVCEPGYIIYTCALADRCKAWGGIPLRPVLPVKSLNSWL